MIVMEFVVTGADASTGKDVSITVRAGDRAEAETLARARGVFVSGTVQVRPGVRQLLFGTAARRRVTAACAIIALSIPLLAWWINVKDSLFAARDSAPTASAPPDRVPEPRVAVPTVADGSAHPRLDFLKRSAAPVWERQDRSAWLARTAGDGPRLISDSDGGRFKEYVTAGHQVKLHAVFFDDRMIIYEVQILRGNRQQAEDYLRSSTAALGAPDSDSIPDRFTDAERRETVMFHEWRIDEAGRSFAVRASVVRAGRSDQSVPTFYFCRDMFVDLAAVNSVAR